MPGKRLKQGDKAGSPIDQAAVLDIDHSQPDRG